MSTKGELLDLMVDEVYGEIELPTGEWRTAMRSLADGVRQAAHRHEWFVDLLGGRPHLGPNALAYLEAALTALNEGLGDINKAIRAAGTVQAYLVGALRSEITEQRAELDKSQWQAASGAYMTRMMATGRYPTLSRVIREATHADPETDFTTGLELVPNGIATS